MKFSSLKENKNTISKIIESTNYDWKVENNKSYPTKILHGHKIAFFEKCWLS